MQVVRDRRLRIVAVFLHYSDAVMFIEEDVQRRGLEVADEPGLDDELARWLARPRVDDGRDA